MQEGDLAEIKFAGDFLLLGFRESGAGGVWDADDG